MAVPFDTLAYARRLKQAGFSEPQAEAQAEALAAVMTDSLATKSDLERLGQELRAELRGMESRITVRLGGMIVAGFGILAVLVEVL